jgi:hypothetical protein
MTGPLQFRCQMCGQYFLLHANYERHRTAEIPKFIEASLIKNREYEASRRRHKLLYPFVTKDALAAAEMDTR